MKQTDYVYARFNVVLGLQRHGKTVAFAKPDFENKTAKVFSRLHSEPLEDIAQAVREYWPTLIVWEEPDCKGM